MKIPENTFFSSDKFCEYLLKKLPDYDKSLFLAVAGYTINNWRSLVKDIREQLLPLDATLSRRTAFGDLYEIRGLLCGPNGKKLKVVSIWMIESESKVSKFITLFPDKEE